MNDQRDESEVAANIDGWLAATKATLHVARMDLTAIWRLLGPTPTED